MTVKDCVVIRLLARIPRADGFALRMATFYAAFFLFGGIQMPYLPAWLQARGLDAREIGIVLAAPMLIRIVAVPFATRLIDRHGEVQIALAIAATLGAAGYAGMGFASGFIAILAVYAAISAVSAPVLTGIAARRFLRTARAQGARRGLRAGAAVGIGGVHPRQHGGRRGVEPTGRRRSRLGTGCHDGGDGGGDVAAAALA